MNKRKVAKKDFTFFIINHPKVLNYAFPQNIPNLFVTWNDFSNGKKYPESVRGSVEIPEDAENEKDYDFYIWE